MSERQQATQDARPSGPSIRQLVFGAPAAKPNASPGPKKPWWPNPRASAGAVMVVAASVAIVAMIVSVFFMCISLHSSGSQITQAVLNGCEGNPGLFQLVRLLRALVRPAHCE